MGTKRLSNISLLLVAVVLFSCNQAKIKPEIEAYLIAALDSIENNAMNSSKLDWKEVRAATLEKAKDAQEFTETYPILAEVLDSLEDNHSFLQKGWESLSASKSKEKRELSPYNTRMAIESGMHELNGKKIARIFVPQGIRGNEFAQNLHDTIIDLASQNPCGWIVDLRGNGGGNMWPMLAGIGHLVGKNPLGGSIGTNGKRDYYKYQDGHSIYVGFNGKENSYAQVEERAFNLNANQPLAFLIDRGTASSGEALAVILKGRKNTRSFGENTYGASTSTKGFRLSDSLNLVLAISTFQDRNKEIYTNGVQPDVEITIGEKMIKPKKDSVISTAIEWILEQEECR